jgi:Zn-dependent protease
MLFILPGARFIVPTTITFFVVLIFAFAYHELAHALIADRLGDPTPRSFGRMTLNPIPHLDRTGLIMALIIGFGFAFTPINPRNLRGNPRVSHAIVSIAGPLANLFMAGLFGLPILLGYVEITPPGQFFPSLYSFLTFGVYYNLLLFALNLLPIPPLDGFRILQGILPMEMAYSLERLVPYSMMIFVLVFFILPFVGLDIAFTIIDPVRSYFYKLLLGGFVPLML